MFKKISVAGFVVVILAVLMLVVILAPSVLAIDQPDTDPQVNAVDVYELESGGLGVFIDYYLDYTSPYPPETATESYLAIFVDTDGTTQLKATAPYTYVDSGYQRGLIWLEFTAAEVVTYSLDSADEALYRVWLQGNPTLSWNGTGEIPKTVGLISDWHDSGDPEVLLAQKVLYYADELEVLWTLGLVEETALGKKLTDTGADYFQNVILNLRDLAPAAFASTTVNPVTTSISYATSLSGVVTGTIVAGSPVTLDDGDNTITANAPGTMDITLGSGTYGSITEDTGTFTGGPTQDLVPGSSNITVTGAGDFTVNIYLNTPQGTLSDNVTGSGFDLSDAADHFHMSTLVFSSLVWFFVSVIIVAAAYGVSRKTMAGDSSGPAAVSMLLFAICLIGGGMLGMLDLRVLALLAIGYAGIIGYVLFFRYAGGDIGRVMMFMLWMWFVVSMVGGFLIGGNAVVITELTADITDSDTTIPVEDTTGFLNVAKIVIDDEVIFYHSKSATSFSGSYFHPLLRGQDGTEAEAHLEGAAVRSQEAALINNSISYSIAEIMDSSGIQAFVTVPMALFDLIRSIMFLPIDFLGTGFWFLTIIWGLFVLGFIVSLFVAMAGGRRV